MGSSPPDRPHRYLHSCQVILTHEDVQHSTVDFLPEGSFESSQSDLVSAEVVIDDGHGPDGFRITDIVNYCNDLRLSSVYKSVGSAQSPDIVNINVLER